MGNECSGLCDNPTLNSGNQLRPIHNTELEYTQPNFDKNYTRQA